MKQQAPLLRFLVLLIVCSAGCSGNDRPATYEATGLVVYQGEPVAGAQVGFVPSEAADAAARPANATTDDSGEFSLATYYRPGEELAGAQPGTYRVTIAKVDAQREIVDPYATGQLPEGALPARYADPERSGLTATITPEGENYFEFTLTD
jgi:hypothetical protein